MNDGIRALDPQDPRDLEAVAKMHTALLPGSPVCQLGAEFMQRFYYRKLVEDGLIHCDLYINEGTPVGFIAYTEIPSRFMSEGLRRHGLYLAGIMILSLLRHPSRIAAVLRTLRIMSRRTRKTEGAQEGEMLSLGVLPQFRSPDFTRRTGTRISSALFENARGYFRNRGVAEIYLLVEAENKPAMMLYKAMGGRFEQDAASKGKSLRVTYSSADRRDYAAAPEKRHADALSSTSLNK